MYTVTRRIEFDSAHRVLGHGGKCAHLHGHRYAAEITARSTGLDNLSMVVDFGVIKNLLSEWIDKHWDHNIILNGDDPLLSVKSHTVFGDRAPYILPRDANPTAEVLAKILFQQATILLPSSIAVTRLRLYETPNCWADYTAEDEATTV